MKTCTICNQEKDEEQFSFRNKDKNIRQAQCKPCQKIWKDRHYTDNKQDYVKKTSQRRSKQVKWFREFKTTLKCESCGEDHPACLDFHHKDSSTKEFNIGQYVRNGGINRLKKEIDKCTILCSNCHRKLHYATFV